MIIYNEFVSKYNIKFFSKKVNKESNFVPTNMSTMGKLFDTHLLMRTMNKEGIIFVGILAVLQLKSDF